MKIAIVASEAIPHAKTGGLADVVGSLPAYLNNLGIKTRIYLPRYKNITGKTVSTLKVDMQGTHRVGIIENGDYSFVDYPRFYDREGLYGNKGGDFSDNCERFTLFAKAVFELITKENFDIVHCHDWQSGLVPLYIKYNGLKTKSVFTIHNLGYQGRFPRDKFPLLGLPEDYFNPEGIEFYGDINFLKAGILYSDIITTVSKNYALEIQTPEFGFGLDGVLSKRRDRLHGIINGIDYDLWSPQTDRLIYKEYSDPSGKEENKSALVKACGIDRARPLIGMVSRIAGQKGFDILEPAFGKIIDLGFNFILLGSGEESYHRRFLQFQDIYKERVSVHIKFDNRLAHQIYAGSDFFLMPSRYEPCGLGQLISLKYGTVPVVRKTGGLADTIEEFTPADESGNGFLFEKYSASGMVEALSRAYQIYQRKEVFTELARRCMTYDFSWQTSARRYQELYNSLLVRP